MKRIFILIYLLAALTPISLFAGVPQTTLQCQSASGNFSIIGRPAGEDFDLTIKNGNAIIRYTNACTDASCQSKDNYGNLIVVDALYDHVFTIYFENNEANNRGEFYAMPNTVTYKKNDRGYTAQYKAIYLGDDPKSNEPFKESVNYPGILLVCAQQNQL